jgi:hypothetical protein
MPAKEMCKTSDRRMAGIVVVVVVIIAVIIIVFLIMRMRGVQPFKRVSHSKPIRSPLGLVEDTPTTPKVLPASLWDAPTRVPNGETKDTFTTRTQRRHATKVERVRESGYTVDVEESEERSESEESSVQSAADRLREDADSKYQLADSDDDEDPPATRRPASRHQEERKETVTSIKGETIWDLFTPKEDTMREYGVTQEEMDGLVEQYRKEHSYEVEKAPTTVNFSVEKWERATDATQDSMRNLTVARKPYEDGLIDALYKEGDV